MKLVAFISSLTVWARLGALAVLWMKRSMAWEILAPAERRPTIDAAISMVVVRRTVGMKESDVCWSWRRLLSWVGVRGMM